VATPLEIRTNFAHSARVDGKPKPHGYEFADTLVVIVTPAYFDPVKDLLLIGDNISITASDGHGYFKVDSLTPVVISEIGSTAPGGTRPYGSIVMNTSNNLMNTTPTPAVIVGPTTLLTSNQFDMPQNGRLRYIGSVTTNFTVHVATSIQADGSSSAQLVRFFMFKNGGNIGNTQAHSLKFSLDLMNVSMVSTLSLAQNDFMEITLNTPSGNFTINTWYLNLVITQAD